MSNEGVKPNLYSVKIVIYTRKMARKPGSTRIRTRPAAAGAASARIMRKPDRRRTGRGGEDAPYHHGALRDALLGAAERVLEREGLAGLTLRAVAREAGVSHAAPTHHFGDLTGLVSELAAIGFRQFNAAMVAAGDRRHLPDGEGDGAGQGLCRLCTGPSRHVRSHVPHRAPRYVAAVAAEAAKASFAGLAGAIGANRQEQISEQALSLDQGAAIARAWSLVHGFTMLLLDGRLSDILRRLPAGTDAETLLDAMLKVTIVRPPKP